MEEEDNDKRDDEDEPYEGSQYSSKGGEMELEDLESQEDKDKDNE